MDNNNGYVRVLTKALMQRQQHTKRKHVVPDQFIDEIALLVILAIVAAGMVAYIFIGGM